jgi:hypothetical protein
MPRPLRGLLRFPARCSRLLLQIFLQIFESPQPIDR